MTESQQNLFLVTGLSGAGLSSTLKILEDLGCEVFDNFPLSLLPSLIQDPQSLSRPIAIGMDTRTRNFDPTELLKFIESQQQNASSLWRIKMIFLSADDNKILQRFTETRRTHPLARDRSVVDGIQTEKSLLYPLKYKADLVVDTSDFSIHDLRRHLEGFVQSSGADKLRINCMSFAYRHGLPREADLVFDVRFLQNPNWVPELKNLTGLNTEVGHYIEQDPDYAAFEKYTRDLLSLLVPRYVQEGKSYLTIAFGCTGGQHRSVYSAEQFSNWLKRSGFQVTIHHRELKGLT
jgi:RNase adapter protein RapZ